MLFDLDRDPGERRNLADGEPELAESLSAELEAWRAARPRLDSTRPSATEIDPATEGQLRALGYLD